MAEVRSSLAKRAWRAALLDVEIYELVTPALEEVGDACLDDHGRVEGERRVVAHATLGMNPRPQTHVCGQHPVGETEGEAGMGPARPIGSDEIQWRLKLPLTVAPNLGPA